MSRFKNLRLPLNPIGVDGSFLIIDNNSLPTALIEYDIIESQDLVEVPIERSLMLKILGPGDSHLRFLEQYFKTDIIAREESLLIPKENDFLLDIIQELVRFCAGKKFLEVKDIETIIRLHRLNIAEPLPPSDDIVILENAQITIKARSANQTAYLRAMRENELVFAIGPAGTGKTFLAVAYAVALLEKGAVDKIVLVKPVVEAGEKLGFLPGDIKEKVDPYFRPLYDALLYMMSAERVKKLIDQSVIEIAPLAYMRGRTLNYSFVILDEAQNTSSMQMKMFLTRLGAESRAVVTGDLTQIDIDVPANSGLVKIQSILTDVPSIRFINLDSSDVMRHRLVANIIKAYDRHSASVSSGKNDSAKEE
jgi:phosphate starvation-inducible protein PhoH and related proteins